MNTKHWVAVDWGTSTCRLWLMSADNKVIAHQANTYGMNTIKHAKEYEPLLLSWVSDWLASDSVLPIYICGMAGSREGWQEAAYLTTPITLSAQLNPCSIKTNDTRIAVYIVPGLKQHAPANVMRGEETQINGFLSEHQHYNGLIILPGTHTKWVEVVAGNVMQFSTAMTGELFALIQSQSILRFSTESSAWHEASFIDAFKTAIAAPLNFNERLFAIRAKHLLENSDKANAYAALSAELIALECSGMQQRFAESLQQRCVIIGNDQLCEIYQLAMQLQNMAVDIYAGNTAVLNGLHAIYQRCFATQFKHERSA